MAYIFKPKNKHKDDAKSIRQKVYQSARWRKLRLAYIMTHPLCEKCHKVMATDVHHIISFVYKPEMERQILAYDWNNLCSLCATCHAQLHNGKG